MLPSVLGVRALRWAELFKSTLGYRNNYAFGAVAGTPVVYGSVRVDWPKPTGWRHRSGQTEARSRQTDEAQRERERLREIDKALRFGHSPSTGWLVPEWLSRYN